MKNQEFNIEEEPRPVKIMTEIKLKDHDISADSNEQDLHYKLLTVDLN